MTEVKVLAAHVPTSPPLRLNKYDLKKGGREFGIATVLFVLLYIVNTAWPQLVESEVLKPSFETAFELYVLPIIMTTIRLLRKPLSATVVTQ